MREYARGRPGRTSRLNGFAISSPNNFIFGNNSKRNVRAKGVKNKHGDRGSLEEEQEHNESKRLNMAESTDEQPTDPPAPEPNMTELKEMLIEIQASISNILTENKLVKTELSELKAAYQSQKRQ